MKLHEGHKLEPLYSVAEKYHPDGAIHDPMSPAYIEVTNGRERLLLWQSRSNIGEPLTFEPITGRLVETGVSFEVQENEIMKEMKYHFQWSGEPLAEAKVRMFIQFFKEVVNDISPQEVEIARFSWDDDNVSFGLLANRFFDILIAKCAAYFGADELADIRRFVDRHREADDIMGLLMRRRMSLQRPAA